MKGRWRAALALIVGAFALSGCIGGWFQRDVQPMLFFGAPVITGDQGEITILVSNMPEGGLAYIDVDLGGVLYDRTLISDVVVEGLNDFWWFTSGIDDGEGRVGFTLAITVFSGVVTGEIAKLTFRANGNVQDGDFVLGKPLIELVSFLTAPIIDWTLPIYYAR